MAGDQGARGEVVDEQLRTAEIAGYQPPVLVDVEPADADAPVPVRRQEGFDDAGRGVPAIDGAVAGAADEE